ncbi:hypothetical protein CONCODRAFT_11498 [Conidiobolus coronatus NRRL 28638]|uniref:RNI-like protein n=1 Tax=Conidiobolus coronatus (strain ATCC 28846 / CBS 209.66 / NRRL 28638) TaxID=796925 RepID=A0A137NUX2_CONC2|nr:hypothetical protein CONCODRAFT_11498 [Conidiobolus coronatus NRRL 28638]|eukprot:KXN66615.1 hypothetical protein CONCODRAFT_11498 [Conidiobolus coronatus NRRL 28638]
MVNITETLNLPKMVSWELIFKLDDLQKYLKKSELNEIVFTSKQVYNTLKTSLFNIINIDDANANSLAKIVSVREQSFNLNYIKKLNISSIPFDSFSIIIENLSNISTLNLTKHYLNLTFINDILSKLNKLNNLKLNQVDIVFNISYFKSNKLKVPLTVRKLSIEACNSFVFSGKSTLFGRENNATRNGPNCPFKTIPTLKFHNLEQLSIKTAITHLAHLNMNPLFKNYFVNNPNLTSLSLEISKFTAESLALMLNLKSLTHLKLIGQNCNFKSTPINLGSSNSLKSLQFNSAIVSYHFDLVLELCKNCNNLKQLTLDYSTHQAPKIDKIISNLPGLNKLTLLAFGYFSSLDLSSINPLLTHINLVNICLLRDEFNLLNTLKGFKVLKLINFDKSGKLNEEKFVRDCIEFGWLNRSYGFNRILSKITSSN